MRAYATAAGIALTVGLLGAAPVTPTESDTVRIRVSSADPFVPQPTFRLIGARGSLGPERVDGVLGDTVTLHVGTTLTLRRGEGRVRIESTRGGPWLRVELLPDARSLKGAGPFTTREFEIRGDTLWYSRHYLPGDPEPPAYDTP